MEWKDAINESQKGTATRISQDDHIKTTTIRYRDGSGYNLVLVDGKVDFFLSCPASEFQLNGHLDWEPSK